MEVQEEEEEDLLLEGAKREVYMEGLLRACATRWVVDRRGLPPLVVLNALVLAPLPRPAKAWERLSMCSSCSCCCCCCGVCGVLGWVWASLSPASSLAPKKSRGGGRWGKGKVGGGEAGRTLLLPAITTGMSSKDRRRESWPSAEEAADGVEVEGEAGGGVGGEEDEDEGLTGGFLAPKLKLTMLW